MKFNKDVVPIKLKLSDINTNNLVFSGIVIKTRDGSLMENDIPNQYFVLKKEFVLPMSEFNAVDFGKYMTVHQNSYKVKESNIFSYQRRYAMDIFNQILLDQNKYPYEITGRLYEKESDGQYVLKEESQFICPCNIKTLSDARKWMLENHSDYYMGCIITQESPYGDTLAIANPNMYANVSGIKDLNEMILQEMNDLGVSELKKQELDYSFLKVPEDIKEEEYDYLEMDR